MDVNGLTVVLAGRLAAIVPAGFYVEAAGGVLCYSADEGRFPGQSGDYRVGDAGTDVRTNVSAHGQTDEERIAGVAVQALDELQDYISEATHDPWPGARNQPPSRARIRDSVLHLWYGRYEDVVLACEPIPLTAIMRSG
jgi:hypothetical protein